MTSFRIPFRVKPMLATLVDAPFHQPGWVYEEKYDGYRVIAYKESHRVSLMTRNMIDRAADFPDIVAALAALPAPTLALDGEVVVFDQSRVSRFQLLQRRGLGEPTNPPVFAVFDCLWARGGDLRPEPLATRRRVLESEVGKPDFLLIARRLADDGLQAFAEAKRRGLEGLIAKDGASPYQAGIRSRSWLKVKVRREEEFVIGGFTAPSGTRAHFGALLVGAYRGTSLHYAGKVGTGFTQRTLADLHRRFRPLVRATSPFCDLAREPHVTWLEPRLVAQIAFTEWTHDHRLRQPVFLGLREDKSATEVEWPEPATPRSGGGSRRVPRRAQARDP